MLTPLDIQNKEFSKSFRGYDVEEVDEFIKKLKEDYEKLYTENIEHKDKISMLSDRMRYYSSMEDSLKETLVLAQGTAADVVKSAQKKAEIIINEAEIQAREDEREVRDKIKKLNSEYEELREEMNSFKNKFILFLESQLTSIKDDLETSEEEVSNIEA